MAATSSVESCISCLSDYDKSLVECLVCHGPISDPVMLKCLHSGCRSCVLESNSGEASTSVKCPACFEETLQSAIISNNLLVGYERLLTLTAESVNCHTCDAVSMASAVFWCSDCGMGLCDSCYSWHNRFNRRHRSAELEIARTWSVSQLMPSVQCRSHKRQMEVQCFTCRQPKCLLCYESCRASQHEVQPVSHASTRVHIITLVKALTSVKEELRCRMSGLHEKLRDTKRNLQVMLSMDGQRRLLVHNRSLQGAAVKAFDTSVREVCVNLERMWCMCTSVMVIPVGLSESISFLARYIKVNWFVRWSRIDLLCKKHVFKDVASRHLSSLTTLLRRRRKYWLENGDFSIGGSLPLTSSIVLRACLGSTEHRAAASRAPLIFTQVSVTFRTPVDCWDLAVTRDGHVLLAAAEHGLLVYSDRGQQLSSWRPERHSDGEEDWVSCVAALTDGRAAVGVHHARRLVLLRRSENGDTWLEDHRVALLQSPPARLAAHSDLLAAAERRRDEQQQNWVLGRQVKLLRLSSGHLLYSHSREYDIWSVALTALCLLTVSSGRVKRNTGATPYVLDAFSHSGEFLWRHETSDEEGVFGLCVSEDTWRRVYAVVWRDWSSSRVMAFSGSDGRHMREVISSRTHGLQIPALLSLARGQQRTVLAVLALDREAKEYRTVSLYEATSSA